MENNIYTAAPSTHAQAFGVDGAAAYILSYEQAELMLFFVSPNVILSSADVGTHYTMKGYTTMENNTNKLENTTEKEIIYIQNKHSFTQELLLCFFKIIIIMIVVSYFLANFPTILHNLNLTNIIEALTSNNTVY